MSTTETIPQIQPPCIDPELGLEVITLTEEEFLAWLGTWALENDAHALYAATQADNITHNPYFGLYSPSDLL